ncbi:branched-chain amino acid ABC transporter permease [Siminovitchia sp. 179-K 8D1 HS]|uniref:branched-chain amino acid ABC transporter permease n=1 Tax=Siminovitchia sp. 179-K 8D1 HS TaxID=3142385 RepID=UPI0039A2017B
MNLRNPLNGSEETINLKSEKSFLGNNILRYKSSKFVYLACAVFLLVFPLLVQRYILHLLILSLIFAILASSWNLIAGYSGIFSFGHQAFFGIGAYGSALMAMRLDVSPWFGLLIGGLMAAIIGVIISLPVLRLRIVPYIAILTLGFAEITKLVTSNLVDLTRGELGLNGIPAFTSIGPISFNLANRINIYYLVLIIFFITIFVVMRIVKGPQGLALKAIKESQDAAESLGVNLTKHKLYVFMISAFIAGISGSLFAHYVQVLTPTSVISIDIMMQILLIVVIGGLGTIAGPVLGSFIVVMGLEYLRVLGDYRLVVYGLIIVLVIMFMPEGIIRKISSKDKLQV